MNKLKFINSEYSDIKKTKGKEENRKALICRRI